MKDKTIETYNKAARHYSEAHFDPAFWSDEFKIFKKMLRGKKIIDVGCGAGRDAVAFTKNNFAYTGIDASKSMLKIAKSRASKGKFVLMSFYDIKFPADAFDGFWCAASLLHSPKRRVSKVLRSIRKIIKEEGIGFISVKKKTKLDEGWLRETKYGGIQRYFSFYTKSEFSKILEKSGFAVIKSHVKIEDDGTRWLCFFVRKTASR